MPYNILFDLDGTLTDSKNGILNGMCFAITRLGYPLPSEEQLDRAIGPPLEDNMMQYLNTQDPALITQATELYHEYYEREGIYQNELYPGIAELLQQLHQQGHRLYLATSKLQDHALICLRQFNLLDYFNSVHGSSRDGSLRYKADIIGHLVNLHQLDPKQSLMIGDHSVDVLGGKKQGMLTIGVTYGYGSEDELSRAVPDRLCHDVIQLTQAIQTLLKTL